MDQTWRYILGTATIIVIVGGTIYAIKKSKDMKDSEESEISLEEAQRIVARGRTANFERNVEEFEAIIYDDESSIEKIGEDEEAPYSEEEYEEDKTEEAGETPDFLYYEEGVDPKEDVDLRYDPNSIDARHQFIRMELAEWRPLEDAYQSLLRLFEFEFQPQNDGDEMLRTQIIDFKVRFFGFNSRWAQEVTIADVILHYSRAAEFNCGESVRYWAEYFLEFNELDLTIPNSTIEESLIQLNSHTYFNEERQTFGLFGLTRNSMDQAIKIANLNLDRSVTYEIEFNEFLKSIV